MKINDKYDVLIDRLNHQGKGIGIIDGRVVFIDDALPGEDVSININHVSNKFISGDVVKYKIFSDNRVVSDCPYYKDCGGCDILHMSYSYQHDCWMWKERR